MADERIQAASTFVLQSPPGEINDVLNDVRAIVNDDGILEQGIIPALREYNLAQFITVDVPDASHQTIVSDLARISSDDQEEEERYLDPRSKTSFKFDHLSLVSGFDYAFHSGICSGSYHQEASDPRPEELNPEAEPRRTALESSALSYLATHYHNGVVAIFPAQSNNQFIVQIVANKYNPSNYWSGRWRSQYNIDFDGNTIQGKVQLVTSHDLTISMPTTIASAVPDSAASKILALIEIEETRLQTSFNDAYHEMSEKAFKGLRRALPLTRQKMDWDKVMGYKLGAELTASKGVFAGS
ncbi:hypothetical protein V8B97DRAFT_189038 [Scleroderma yunnanense]